MSKVTRISLAVLVSVIVIIAIFTTVQGASLSAQPDRAGTHLVSGPRANLDHYREAAPAPAAIYEQDEFSSDRPMGCHHESQTSPDD